MPDVQRRKPWPSTVTIGGGFGLLYEQGTGVGQNAAKAAALYQKACDGGQMRGCVNLGFLYEQGTGVSQDAAKAAALYHKACDGGERQACARAR